MQRSKVLLTGATGYIGGRLLEKLEADGRYVRCLARKPEYLAGRVAPETELIEGDVHDRSVLRRAMEGVETAYYLIHAMDSGKDFEEQDRKAAVLFGEVAHETGVNRIIYLGGLGSHDDLSPHLRSRHEVGRILRESGVQTIEFRASIVIGSGSVSFELIRGLVRKLPVMITPRWVRTPAQPIAVEDVIEYLAAGFTFEGNESRIFEIGGAEQVSYGDLMMEYARQRKLKRLMVPVPFLSLRLSSLWLGLVTPVYARIGRKMIGSVRNDTTVKDESALEAFDIRPRSYRDAIARALTNEDHEVSQTRWSDAISSRGYKRSFGGIRMHNRIIDSRAAVVAEPPEVAFRPIQRIGGDAGWYFGDWLWKLRGFLDLLAGGVGVRRGRRDPDNLQIGDALDLWRVEDYEPGRRLLLQAEMKVPGRAWLSFEVTAHPAGSQIRQTAIFDPGGLGGLLYWYGLYPLHRIVFSGMLRGLQRAVGRMAADEGHAATTASKPAASSTASRRTRALPVSSR